MNSCYTLTDKSILSVCLFICFPSVFLWDNQVTQARFWTHNLPASPSQVIAGTWHCVHPWLDSTCFSSEDFNAVMQIITVPPLPVRLKKNILRSSPYSMVFRGKGGRREHRMRAQESPAAIVSSCSGSSRLTEKSSSLPGHQIAIGLTLSLGSNWQYKPLMTPSPLRYSHSTGGGGCLETDKQSPRISS
jgi:hypothetical protein